MSVDLGDSHYTFNYNYALHGIPSAEQRGGDAPTRGLKLEANQRGQNFSGNYTLRFDACRMLRLMAAGRLNFRRRHRLRHADVASGAQAMSTAEGGSSNDWRAFKSPPQFFIDYVDNTAGGTHQGSDP